MTASAPRAARPLPRAVQGVAVKVCGLTRPEDAALAARLGAAALGVVLAPGPRRLDLHRAAAVLAAATPGTARFGVFVDPDSAFVTEAVRICALDWVQLSGREPAAAALAIAAALGDPTVTPPGGARAGLIRAVHVRGDDDIRDLAGYPADAFLLDSPPLRTEGVEQMGGTGRPFDWSRAATLPWGRDRVALAGGLRAENLAAAVLAVRPALVDVSSGVESSPGIKDPARLAAFLDAARQIDFQEVGCQA
jgi:phosphoribosylanthranilate isomerase